MSLRDGKHEAPVRAGGSVFPAGFVGSFSTNDLDELAGVVPALGLEFSQLGRGRFAGRLFVAHTADFAVARVAWSPGVIARGTVPKATILIALPLQRGPRVASRGSQVPYDRSVLLFDDDRIEFLTPAPLEAVVLIARREAVERRVEAIFGRPLDAFRTGEHIVIHEPARLRAHLDGHTARLERALLADRSGLLTAAGAAELESTLVDSVLFAMDQPAPSVAPAHDRQRVAVNAERLLREHLPTGLAIDEVCLALDTSERTLHAAFREHFGVTPKAYSKILRLNAARRALRHARDGETVTEIAARWDFLHFGWFAHDYSLMFDELPSETLQRAALSRTRGI